MKKDHKVLGSQRFWNRVDFLNRGKNFNSETLINYQNKTLKRLIKLAYNNSFYYKNLMDKEGISPADIKTIFDLKHFPISDKDDLKNAGDNILTTNKSKQITTRFTGGSSGNPLCVKANNSFYSKDKANTFFYVDSFGHNIFSSKSVRIYGESIRDSLGNDILYSKGSNKNRLEINVYLINPFNIKDIMEELLIHQPEYIHGRMSAITHLAKLILNEDKDYKVDSLKSIFVDGETVLSIDRKIIEKALKAYLINIYGHTEGALFAIQSNSDESLKVQGISGIIEVIDKNQKIKNAGQGEVIVTGLNNFAMPFIRYRTGDEVTLNYSEKENHHNYLVFNSLVGRKIDYLYTKEKDPIPLSSLFYNYDDVNWSNVKYWKAYQPSLGKVNVTLELFSNFNENEKKYICKRIEKQLSILSGKSLFITVEEGLINPNSRGKVRNFTPYYI